MRVSVTFRLYDITADLLQGIGPLNYNIDFFSEVKFDTVSPRACQSRMILLNPTCTIVADVTKSISGRHMTNGIEIFTGKE